MRIINSLPTNRIINWMVLFSGVSFAVVFAALFWLISRPQPPPFAYLGDINEDGVIEYIAENPTLCPGDNLLYTPQIDIRRVGVTVDLRFSIYDRTVSGTIWSRDIGLNTHEVVLSQNQIPQRIPLQSELIRPDAWQPGHEYEFMSNTRTLGGDAYVVRFTIASDCDL